MSVVRGGIKAGDSFLLVTVSNSGGNSGPAILNSAPNGSGIIYYWETNIELLLNSTNMPVFTATTTVNTASPQGPQQLLIVDTINTGGIGFRQDGITLGNAVSAAPVIISEPIYAPWNDPFILLSNIPYNITTTTGKTAKIFTGNTVTSTTVDATGIIILPVVIYGNCPQCGSITDPHVSAANWYCLTNPAGQVCDNVTTLNPSWTSLSDATALLKYSYCTVGKVCGDDSCRGPCTTSYDDCNPSNGSFKCVINTERFLTTTKWYESPYFIAAIIFILIMIVLVIIVVIAIVRRVSTSAIKKVQAASAASSTS